jgi:glyoxylase-like metal-dependent hydrolase (beta-lactamase superfamily II)
MAVRIEAGSTCGMASNRQYNRAAPHETAAAGTRRMVLSHGITGIDLHFLGRAHTIAALVLDAPAGVAVVDPGPTTCLAELEAGLGRRGLTLADVTDLLITHIHLDHSGAVGVILRTNPRIRVWVHERGARHLADPQRLVESAARLYGDRMERLWGEIAPVPEDRIVTLAGGERIVAGGRRLDVAYTPGHASHHVSYFDRESGIAMVGDTAGVCVDGGFVLPPTPPPDIDVEAWRTSVARIEAWSPATLFLTHFGAAPTVRPHLQALLENLAMMTAWVEDTLRQPGTDEERAATFTERLTLHLRQRLSDPQMASYPVAVPFVQMWLGLARYCRKRAAVSSP